MDLHMQRKFEVKILNLDVNLPLQREFQVNSNTDLLNPT